MSDTISRTGLRSTGTGTPAPSSGTSMGGRKGMWSLVLLIVSAILGLAVLGTDANIWRDAPTHAYGLVAFVVIDLVLLGWTFMKPNKMSLRLVAAFGAIQVLAMLADITQAPASYHFTTTQFATYLFGLGYYDSYHIAFLFPALFVVNVLLTAIAFLESKKA